MIQPFFTMVVFSLFFGKLAKVPSEGLPYPVFSFVGLVPWTFFANGVSASANSLVGRANLIKKVYFPRLVVPVAAVIKGLPDFAISFIVLLLMISYYGYVPPASSVFWAPLFLLLAMTASLGVGLWLSALNVKYRDIAYIVPFLVQFWLFATPIANPASLLNEPWSTVYAFNPMVRVVEGFRWALLGSVPYPGPILSASCATALLLLMTGALYFRRTERSFADVV